jgi:hypothetical protein
MYHLLPELAGDTRVYVDDDSIANVIAGILYPNPTGTKMHAVGEAYRSRTINRIAGNVAANTDRNRHILQTEFSVSEKIDLTPGGFVQLDVSGRFYVQDFPNGAADTPIYATLVDSNGSPITETVTDIQGYDDATTLWTTLPANGTPIVVVNTNAVTSMTTGSVVATTVTSVFSSAQPGDHCELIGGVNAGTYLIDRIIGTELFLTELDGEPLKQASGQSGFDTSDVPTDCKIWSSGHFITNPRLIFSAAIPAGTNYLILGRSGKIGDAVLVFPGVESTFPESSGGAPLSDTLQTAYNAGNTITLAASTDLTISVPASDPGLFEVVGAGTFFKVGNSDSSGRVDVLTAVVDQIGLTATDNIGVSSGAGGIEIYALEAGVIDVHTVGAAVGSDSGNIAIITGGETYTQIGYDSGHLLLASGGAFSVGVDRGSGNVLLYSGDGRGVRGSGEVAITSGSVESAASGNVSLQSGGAILAGPSGNLTLRTGQGAEDDSGTVTITSGDIPSGAAAAISGDIVVGTGSTDGGLSLRRSGAVLITTGAGNTVTGRFSVETGSIPSALPGGYSGPILFETGQARGGGEEAELRTVPSSYRTR